ncbi:trimeric LpxA-like protein [Myriangium duriaei CBS 260.36]|uniref:Trimeric LpxA-like protein n=1 Tax=Myriangium duriaei CBS 260.36 TaxID=1168546 RepID=A0A9P4IYB6_9PEZI|nr:trimeric LpxA-like protein [Myriangium duriaei CBS 260.36]
MSDIPNYCPVKNPMTENRLRSLRGELYHAFAPDMLADRMRCARNLKAFNNSDDETRRGQTALWRKILGDDTPLPPRKEGSTEEEDDLLFDNDPVVIPPFRVDNGINVKVGERTFINYNCTIVDTCLVDIGARILFGPNVSIYSGTHPLDPELRDGMRGPEMGKPIKIDDDCWIGGNAIILAGVTIGKGCTVGAGSVVTKVSLGTSPHQEFADRCAGCA